MYQNQKTVWLSNTILGLAILLNVVIIKIAYSENQNLFWISIVSAPLLVIILLNSKQIKNLFGKYFIDSLQPFVRQTHFEWLATSSYRDKIDEVDLNILIGNEQCDKPYNACLLSIRGWENTNYMVSHTELNGKESEAHGRIKLSFPNTFNSSPVGPVWQVESTYRGCRTENGNFDSLAFKRIASIPGVKMIEINLNSSVNSDHLIGSILGMKKPIGARGKPDLFTSSGYTTFRDAEGLVHFIESLRNLSSGKPVGIRLSITDRKDFRKICHAIRKTHIIPDFIVVTGSSGKTAFTHSDLLFYPEMPLYEALLFVSQTLQTYGLDKDIKVIAAGEIISGFDILKMLALGANSVCIDSDCFNIPELGHRHEMKSPYWNSNIHYRLMKELVQIMNVGRFRSIKDVTLSKFLLRLDILHSKRYTQTEKQVIYRGSLKKMFYGKVNKIESEHRKSQEKASLQ